MQMNRIVMHHTAGWLAASRRHYHRLIDPDGTVHAGAHPIAANAPGRVLTTGTYAAHTAMLNSGAIGVALVAMAGAEWRDPRACPNFARPAQVEAMVQEIAKLCVEYFIEPTRRTVLSHAEVEITLGVKQAGKWDFDYDPFGITDDRDPVVVGDMLRAHVARAIIGLGFDTPTAPRGPRPVLRRGATGEFVTEMQSLLVLHGFKIAADGIFGPKTFDAVLAFQKSSQLLPDGICGRLTWAALHQEK